MDRLIALVGLRWRLDLRGLLGARERLVGLALLAPMALLGSAVGAAVVFFGVRFLERQYPEALLPALSVLATLAGLLWAFSPLLVGVAFSETHDMSRLLHFPLSFWVLVASSLVANLTEPMVLVRLPVLLALAAALSSSLASFPAALAGVLASFAFILAAAQLVGLLLHGLARNRRLQDRVLFVGIGLGFLLSVLPLLFLSGRMGPIVRLLLERDLFVLSPFSWGVRAAVHAGRGEAIAFLLFLGAGSVGLAAAMGLSALLVRRIYRGELVLGGPQSGAAAEGAPMRLPGTLGALLEKDLRIIWRDPRLKAMLFTSVLAPLLLLLILWPRGRGSVSAPALLLLASFTGIAGFGANAFALERRGLLLLMGFPVERWRILVAKNVGVLLLRLPGLVLLVLAVILLGVPQLLAPVVVVALVTMLLAAGADNFLSVLFPVPVPEPGRNPYGSVSGGRGLGAAAVAAVLLMGVVMLSAPFVFLAWLPLLLGAPSIWLVSLPLALGGAGATYFMLVTGAAGLLERREPELLARVLAEE